MMRSRSDFRLVGLGSQETGEGIDFVDVSWCTRLTMLAKQIDVPVDGGVPFQMRMTATSPDGVESVAYFGPSTRIGPGGEGVAGEARLGIPWA
jgi:hypothetical protein